MNSLLNLIRPDLRSFKPYSSARDEAKQGKIWLNANELPWNHHDDEEMRINRYPEKQPARLIEKISSLYQVQPDQLALFRGSDEAIDLLTRLFCRAEHDAIMICPPTFGMYAICAKLQGASIIEVPLSKEKDFQLDITAIQQQWTPAVKLIYVCAPNNPTANNIHTSDILKLCEMFLSKCMVIVDEAYVEFSSQPSLSAHISQYESLAVLRTFSKAYGLAGARFGALLAQPELIQWMRAIMAPYPLSVPTIHAIEKSLTPARLKKIQNYAECIKEQRTYLIEKLSGMSIVKKIYPSEANFILVEVIDGEKIMRFCMQHGVVLRSMHNRPGLENSIRMSVGTPEENEVLLDVLSKI